jgi:zinc transport system substrate-binding protein
VFGAALSASCEGGRAEPTESAMLVFVSIPPQKYFVERIAGSHVRVEVLVGPGQSHHTYEATPRQIAGLHRARAYFRIGVPFEHGLVEKIGASMPHLEIIDTSRGVPLIDMKEECDEPGETAEEHAHESGKDPHIWLDPKRVKVQARTIAAELTRLDPAHREEFARNLAEFEKDLDAADASIARKLSPVRGREFFVFHPAYGYFADAYGLKQVAVESGGKEPSLRGLTRLIRTARRDNARIIFVQPQFPVAAAQSVAQAIGGKVVPADPLSTDYLRNLENMADQILGALTAGNDRVSLRSAQP